MLRERLQTRDLERASHSCTEGSQEQRGYKETDRSAMVVHTAQAFHTPMPPTAPRPLYAPLSPTAPRPSWPLQPRLSVAPMPDLHCSRRVCWVCHTLHDGHAAGVVNCGSAKTSAPPQGSASAHLSWQRPLKVSARRGERCTHRHVQCAGHGPGSSDQLSFTEKG